MFGFIKPGIASHSLGWSPGMVMPSSGAASVAAEEVDFALRFIGNADGAPLTAAIMPTHSISSQDDIGDYTFALKNDVSHPTCDRTTIIDHAIADDMPMSIGGVALNLSDEQAVWQSLAGWNGFSGPPYEGIRITAANLPAGCTVSVTALCYFENTSGVLSDDNSAMDTFILYGGGGWGVAEYYCPYQWTGIGWVHAHNDTGHAYGMNANWRKQRMTSPGWARIILRLNVETGRTEVLMVDPATRYLIGYSELPIAYTGGGAVFEWFDYISAWQGNRGLLGLRMKWGFLQGSWTIRPLAVIDAMQNADDSVRLRWEIAAEWIKYDVERAELVDGSPGAYSTLATDLSAMSFTDALGYHMAYTDATATSPGDYRYRITAKHEGRTSVATADVSVNNATFLQFFEDDFSQSPAFPDPLISPWVTPISTSGAVAVLGGATYGIDTGNCVAVLGAPAFGPDQEASIEINGAFLFAPGAPMVRASTSAITGYIVRVGYIDGVDGDWQIGRVVAGVITTLTNTTAPWVPNDAEIKLRVVGDGTTGNEVTLSAYCNGALMTSVQDTASPILTGQPGQFLTDAGSHIAKVFYATEV